MLKKLKRYGLFLTSLLFLASASQVEAAPSVQCLNKEGKPVDWWIILKLPKTIGSIVKQQEITNGLNFLYIDQDYNKIMHKEFFEGNEISQTDSTKHIYHDLSGPNPVKTTLDQIYTSDGSDRSWVMYNDAIPNLPKPYHSEYGHSKGIVAFDNTTGFWLIQTTPGFPPVKEDGYSFPNTGKWNGQTMLCISLSTTQFEDVGKQFHYTNCRAYSSHFHNELLAPTMQGVVNGTIKYNAIVPRFDQRFYISRGNTKFSSFAQTNTISVSYDPSIAPPHSKPNCDFYANAANGKYKCNTSFKTPLKHNLFVQSWLDRNKAPAQLIPSTNEPQICDAPYHVNSALANYALDYKFDLNSITGQEFNCKGQIKCHWGTLNDHSKWAVSTEVGSDVVCISDLNRTEMQKKRGGIMMCFKNKDVHDVFYNMIQTPIRCTQ